MVPRVVAKTSSRLSIISRFSAIIVGSSKNTGSLAKRMSAGLAVR
jgi:hypothetical protein